ncbi:MAG: hypothetical protein A3J51_05085 [Omnitrophica WOR_2 bacterium RIFCSPHIGHO2_02_FULL_45_21]|nr:MAG: hypothetical protein A3J51_05085 [Omnitrophica WOR_2 bacterium RIFCSPHIGHO2_02_FULL_45_21]
MAKRKNKNYIFLGKLLLLLLLIVVCIMAALSMLKAFFAGSSYFTITRVAIEGLGPLETTALPEETKRFLTGLVGKNIFSQNLKAIKKQIEASADIECILISRRMPGELVFKLKKRIPLAQLKLTRYHLVDPAGILIAGASDAAYGNLPVILGLENKNSQGEAQQYYPGTPELSLALELIKEKNNAPAMTHYRLTRVHLLNHKASSFFIVENFPESGLIKKNTPLVQMEIKFDLQRPVETIRLLGALLDKLQAPGNPRVPRREQEGVSPLEGIEYIDLRNTDSPLVMEKKKNKR